VLLLWNFISIPYGAIKSLLNKFNIIITFISIPYGAIKRLYFVAYHFKLLIISIPYGAIKRILAFPFYITTALISIPYGAIKSIRLAYTLLAIFSFQFLMVRLKELN